MKKKLTKKILALIACLIMCMATITPAFAADIPYTNIQTTGTAATTGYINTNNFSGYAGVSIGHFTIQTQEYSSDTNISVVIYYGNNQVAYYLMSGNGKRENIGMNQNFFYPAGTYRIQVTAYGSDTTGWTGVWLYH